MAFSTEQFRKGFTCIPNELLLDANCRAVERAVFVSIRSFMYGDRKSWAPSYREIAKRAGCSPRTARTAARRLEELGYFMITRPLPPEGQVKPGRPAHKFTLVENREAFLKDRTERDRRHAEKVEQDLHRQAVEIQARAFGGKLSPEEANAELRKIEASMARRSPRVPLQGLSRIK